MIFFSTVKTEHTNLTTQIKKDCKSLEPILDNILKKGLLGTPSFPSDFQSKCEIALQSKDGIIIDENLPFRKKFIDFSLSIGQILSDLKSRYKDKVIAIYHSVLLTPKFAKAYKNLDLIFIESYWSWKSNFMLWLFFKINWHIAKKWGVLDKIVYLLGINQNPLKFNIFKPITWWNSIPWTNDENTLNKQLNYIKEKCPDTAGIGFYVTSSTQEYMEVVDKTVTKLYNL